MWTETSCDLQCRTPSITENTQLFAGLVTWWPVSMYPNHFTGHLAFKKKRNKKQTKFSVEKLWVSNRFPQVEWCVWRVPFVGPVQRWWPRHTEAASGTAGMASARPGPRPLWGPAHCPAEWQVQGWPQGGRRCCTRTTLGFPRQKEVIMGNIYLFFFFPFFLSSSSRSLPVAISAAFFWIFFNRKSQQVQEKSFLIKLQIVLSYFKGDGWLKQLIKGRILGWPRPCSLQGSNCGAVISGPPASAAAVGGGHCIWSTVSTADFPHLPEWTHALQGHSGTRPLACGHLTPRRLGTVSSRKHC